MTVDPFGPQDPFAPPFGGGSATITHTTVQALVMQATALLNQAIAILNTVSTDLNSLQP